MLTLLFWNVRHDRDAKHLSLASQRRLRCICDAIVALTAMHEIDVLVFAELQLPAVEVTASLQIATGQSFTEAESDGICDKIRIFTPYPNSCLPIPKASDARYTVREVKTLHHSDFLLVAAHLPYKSSSRTSFRRSQYCAGMAHNIRVAEQSLQHQRTLLIGDLNVNPYEPEVTGALQGVMTRTLALAKRDEQNGMYTRFYNPMWGHFGKTNGVPAGTYYWDGEEDEHYWQIYDQVLLRPPLFAHFDERDLHILTVAGNTQLVTTTGRPRKRAVSDHLPILIKLNL